MNERRMLGKFIEQLEPGYSFRVAHLEDGCWLVQVIDERGVDVEPGMRRRGAIRSSLREALVAARENTG